VKKTSVCVVDDVGTVYPSGEVSPDAYGTVILEQKVRSEPADLIALLTSLGESYGRIGIEAGPLSQWLAGFAIAWLPPVHTVDDARGSLRAIRPRADARPVSRQGIWRLK
jgi:transposase